MSVRIKIPAGLAGDRADIMLAKLNRHDLSRSAATKIIKKGLFKLDGKVINKPDFFISGGIISYSLPNKTIPMKIDIIYEDKDVIVVNKPAGILSHAKGVLSEETTVADYFKPKIKDDKTNRPGIVHRLDRATSGIMIIAKHLEAKKYLQKQFSSRKVQKEYIALVKNIIKDDELIMDWPIARNPKKPALFKVKAGGKEAITHLMVIKRFNGMTKVLLKPKTGRTHQLRVHLSHLGHPIVGDQFYGQIKPKTDQQLYLHAISIEINLPTGQRQRFKAEIPEYFSDEEVCYV